jgi:predicted RNase H-like HicB family nuclease
MHALGSHLLPRVGFSGKFDLMRAVKYCLYKEEPYFVAQGLSVDISTFGKTREEAAANFREALQLYFEGEQDPDYVDISEVTIGEELIGA